MSLRLAPLVTLAVALLAGCASQAHKPIQLSDGARASVAILETTDIHANVLSFDYYKLKPDDSLGFERTATLIRRARTEFPNTFLFTAATPSRAACRPTIRRS